MICGALSQTAARYQTTTRAPSTARIGAGAVEQLRFTPRMADERDAQSMRDGHEFRRFADVQRPVRGQARLDDLDDAPPAVPT